jgi:hypothetical protein
MNRSSACINTIQPISSDRYPAESSPHREKDSISSGLFVPTWNFFGTGAYTRAGETMPVNDGNKQLLLSINAVDGTLMNPLQGY